MNRARRCREPRLAVAAVGAALASAACSPTFDWRETRLEGSTLISMFPCKPDRQSRLVDMRGGGGAAGPGAVTKQIQMQMLACAAGDATFALVAGELADPTLAPAVLQQLRSSAIANVRGGAPQTAAWVLAGTTPYAEAGRISVNGRLPDGTTVVEHAAFFAQGAKVFQASVIGGKPNAEAVETFFAGLKFQP